MGTHANRTEVLSKILTLCRDEAKTTEELSSLLNMNYNTLRSKYVYYLLKKDKLRRFNRKYITK